MAVDVKMVSINLFAIVCLVMVVSVAKQISTNAVLTHANMVDYVPTY